MQSRPGARSHMSVRLTVWDGADVIGGNKILLETEEARVFFDFGTTFAARERYFEEYLKPRSTRGLLDLASLGLLPPLLGLYREDLLLGGLGGACCQRLRRQPGCREIGPVDGVFLSHAHIDHSGYISFLRPDIPVYSTAMTAAIAKAMQDSSISDFEKEVCYLTPRQQSQEGTVESTDWRRVPHQGRQFYTLDGPPPPEVCQFWSSCCGGRRLEACDLTEAPARIGALPARTFPVDHSIYGASACAVQTELGWVVYTGDLRLHGQRGSLTQEFARQVASLQPYLLICEGTHVGDGRVTSEEEVHERCLKAVREAEGLVVADFGPRNVERLLIFRQIAERTGRRLAILAKDAYLLEAMRSADPTVPTVGVDGFLRIYRDVKAKLQTWESSLLERYRPCCVDAAEVQRHQSEYILCLSFWDVNELVDVEPQPGSVYIYSSSEAYSEEQKIDRVRLLNWIDRFQMDLVGIDRSQEDLPNADGYHASGHITGPELLSLIGEIRPRALVPVHTQKPEFFTENLRAVCLVIVPERGQEIALG